jgi:hypothetical protein
MSEFSVESILFKDDLNNSFSSGVKVKNTKSMDELAYEMAKSEEDLKFFETYSMINDYNTNQKLRMLKRLNNVTNRIKNRNISNSCESYINSIVYSLEDDNPTSTDQSAGGTNAEGGEASETKEETPEKTEKKKNIFIRFFTAIGRAIKAAAMFVVRQIKHFLNWISRGKWFKDWDDGKKKNDNSANLKGNAPEGGSDNGGGEEETPAEESGSTSEGPKSLPAPEKKEEPKQQAPEKQEMPEKDKYEQMKNELSKILAQFGLSQIGYLNIARGSKFTPSKFKAINDAVNAYAKDILNTIKMHKGATNSKQLNAGFKKKISNTNKAIDRYFVRSAVEEIRKLVENQSGEANSLVDYIKIFCDKPMFVKLPTNITNTTIVDIKNTFNRDALKMISDCLSIAADLSEKSAKQLNFVSEEIIKSLKSGQLLGQKATGAKIGVVNEIKDTTEGIGKIKMKCDKGTVEVVKYTTAMMRWINVYVN